MSTEAKNKINHVAIIMDGNGRWAQERAHRRIWGHVRGSRIVSDIVEEAKENGVKALTLYTFSSENWSRPLDEIKTLFKLLKKYIIKEEKRIIKNRLRFKVMGDISRLPEKTRQLITDLEQKTSDMEGMKLTFAFSYGGRGEIIQAVNRFIEENPGEKITEAEMERCLLLPDIGDVDLMIRTGGDQRISNFLLWQSAYAELFFTESKWPEFTCKEFRDILDKVSGRERRFGSVDAKEKLEETVQLAEQNKVLLTKQLDS
jgi:undecaprenyl diphosphate synthase